MGVRALVAGGAHAFHARRAVLLAAGALGTPALLMRSGVGDPLELQALGVDVLLANREVGQHLADHLAYFSWFGLQSEEPIEAEDPACCSKEVAIA